MAVCHLEDNGVKLRLTSVMGVSDIPSDQVIQGECLWPCPVRKLDQPSVPRSLDGRNHHHFRVVVVTDMQIEVGGDPSHVALLDDERPVASDVRRRRRHDNDTDVPPLESQTAGRWPWRWRTPSGPACGCGRNGRSPLQIVGMWRSRPTSRRCSRPSRSWWVRRWSASSSGQRSGCG